VLALPSAYLDAESHRVSSIMESQSEAVTVSAHLQRNTQPARHNIA
jgi:hypothetical protein